MKIKSGLVFNKHTGSLSGFVDLGATSHDVELAVHAGGSEDEAPLTSLHSWQELSLSPHCLFQLLIISV